MRRSTRNQGRGAAYNSSPRNFRRGGNYRRGGQKPHFPSSSYPPPPPPPPPLPPPRRKIDVLMEAGKLAAEYLVAKGLLPPSSLPPQPPSRWVTASASAQEFKGRDRENMQYDRVSALNRLGGVDTGSVRRRYVDGEEFDDGGGTGGTRSSMRGRRRRGVDDYTNDNGGYGGDGQWRSRESWMDKPRGFNDSGYGDTDNFSPGYRRGGSDFGDFSGGRVGLRGGATDVINFGNDVVMEESECDFQEEPVSKVNFPNTKKESMEERDGNFSKGEDDRRTHVEIGEVRSAKSSSDVGKWEEEEENSDSSVGVSKQENDSLKLPIFTKVPTKPRSMVVTKILKVEPGPAAVDAVKKKVDQPGSAENGKTCDVDKLSAGVSSSDQIMDLAPNPVGSASEETARMPFQHIEEPTNAKSDGLTEKKSSVGSLPFLERSSSLVQHLTESEDGILDSVFDIENKVYTKSSSFPERSSLEHNQMDMRQSDAFETKMEDGFLLHDPKSEGVKRQRDWSSSVILHDDDYLQVRSLRAKQSNSSSQIPMSDEEIGAPIDQKKLVNADLFPKTEPETSMKFKEEKNLLSNSFRICDLNLSESHDVTEIHDDVVLKQKPGTNPTMETSKAPTVDFGLSVGHNSNDINIYGQCSSDNKMIQVINLEDDSSGEDGACDLPKPKSEAMYSNLENFLNNTENTVDLPDIPDGYDLPMSDLIESDMSSCPAVPGEMNSLQQGMGLLEEGLTGDDDSIYVSLGEIPMSFMEAWDPPPQEYGKEQQNP